jgi:hypothetical protein
VFVSRNLLIVPTKDRRQILLPKAERASRIAKHGTVDARGFGQNHTRCTALVAGKLVTAQGYFTTRWAGFNHAGAILHGVAPDLRDMLVSTARHSFIAVRAFHRLPPVIVIIIIVIRVGTLLRRSP